MSLKFTKGWHPAFFGAEKFLDDSDPYYANTEFGTIIIEGLGITLCEYDLENDESIEYCVPMDFSLNEVSAEYIIKLLEMFNETQLKEWVNDLKENSEMYF